MSPVDHTRLRELFEAVMDRAPHERSGYLDQACGANAELRAEIDSLLVHHDLKTAPLADDDVGLGPKLARASRDANPSTTAAETALPKRVGQYDIVKLLGEGGMGVVYLARQKDPERTVAIKIVRGAAMSPELLRRFRYEVQVLGHLKHPGIAQIYEAATEDTPYGVQPFFVMEYVEGPSLDQYVRDRKPGTRMRLELLARLCDAVHYAHQKGVIHRDLKPGNVLVVDNEHDPAGVGRPKILDFGVARATDSDVQTIQTHSGQILGTIPYMSPEQICGRTTELDTRSDVYALGVILFEVLTGRLPHALRERTLIEAIQIIRNEEPTRVAAVDTTFRGDIDAIVTKALEKDPQRRYESAAELAADIRRFLRREPIIARPQTALYQFQKFAARNRSLVYASCALLFVLMAGLASSAFFAFREHEQRQVAEARFNALSTFSEQVINRYPTMQDNVGEAQARAFLMKTASQYLDTLATDSRGLDVAVLANLASSYRAVGDILGQPQAINVGNPTDALENYLKGIAVQETVVARAPSRVHQRNLAILHERAGNIDLTEQRYEEALQHYQESHRIKMGIAEDDHDGQRDLSFSYNKLGDVYKHMNRKDQAQDMYARSLALRKQLAEALPDSQPIQRAYSVGLNRVGDVLFELDRLEEALAHYRESQDRRLARLSAQPDNRQARMDAAVGHMRLGNCLRKLDRTDEALSAMTASRDILRSMAQEDPGNIAVGLGAAELSGQIGRVLMDLDRLEPALQELTDMLNAVAAIMPQDQLPAQARVFVAEGHQLRGRVLLELAGNAPMDSENKLNLTTDGCKALRQAATIYDTLGETESELQPQLHTELSVCEAGDTPL